MKKMVNGIILVLLLLIPVFINADNVNYSRAVDRANNYIKKPVFSDRSKYINMNTKLYLYENGSLSRDENNLFKTGGMLSKTEYDLSKDSNGLSYLLIGQKYWTLTTSSSGKKYFIENYLDEKSTSDTAGVRSTVFANPDVYITGKGTYNTPWEFKAYYVVKITPRNNHGTVECANSTNCSKTNNTVIKDKIEPGSSVSFIINPNVGYEYNENSTCNLKKDGSYYKIDNITSDIICTLEWKLSDYTITYDTKGGNACSPSTKTVTYSKKYGELCSPTRDGYTFNGWYKEETYDNYVNKDSMVTETNNHTLYARWCQDCASVSNGTCTLDASTPGTCNYTASCDSGYDLSGEGTREPTCKAEQSYYYGCVSDPSVCYNGDCAFPASPRECQSGWVCDERRCFGG